MKPSEQRIGQSWFALDRIDHMTSTSFAFLFPGQGSQHVGMGKSFFDAYASVRARFAEASDILQKDFARLCFDDPESALVHTDNAQPAITLVSLAIVDVLRDLGYVPSAVAGHSVGEYAALCAAEALSFADAMKVVQVRGHAMKHAAERYPGGMVAVFGLDLDILATICEDVRDVGSVEVANQNSPVQTVLTGESDAVHRAATLAKQQGARLVVPLKVSGAWHSRFMADAQEPVASALAQGALTPPRIPVIANVNAEEYPPDPGIIREMLVAQITRPVLWSRSMSRLIAMGHSTFVEVGPGKTLTRLLKDISRAVTAMHVQDVDTLQQFRDVHTGTPAS